MAEKPAGSRKNLNQVEINAQWNEAVKKEMRGRVLNENFDFNPKNLIVISDKPTTITKEMEQTAEAKNAMMAVTKKLEVLTTIPTKKYPYAMTAS